MRAVRPKMMAAVMTTAALALASCSLTGATAATAPTCADILKQAPFRPGDATLFAPSTYPSKLPLRPAGRYKVTEAGLREQAQHILAHTTSTKLADQALRRYFDDTTAKHVVPDPRLRAALVLLTGTPAGSTMAGVMDGTYSRIQFHSLAGTSAQGGFAAVLKVPGDPKLQIWLEPRYQYEDIRLLAPILSHENLHHDAPNTQAEELVNTALESLTVSWFMLKFPEVAAARTELSRRYLGSVVARLNDRDHSGQLRLLVTPKGRTVLPGSLKRWSNFAAPFAAKGPITGQSTPGSEYLRGYVKWTTDIDPGDSVAFNDPLIQLLDHHQTFLSARDIVQLAHQLKLKGAPADCRA